MNKQIHEPRNLTMLTDFYQLTMMDGYLSSGIHEEIATFDLFFRQRGQINYAVAAGLEQAIEYIQDLHFSAEDIEYLRSLNTFTDKFLDYLKDLRFTGDIYSVREGEIVFPMEPIMIVILAIIIFFVIISIIMPIYDSYGMIA